MDFYSLLVVLAIVGVLIYFGITKAFDWIGFTKDGIRAASSAAVWMSSSAIASGGGVVAGSAVSIMQAAAATGTIGKIAAAVAFVGVIVVCAGKFYFTGSTI